MASKRIQLVEHDGLKYEVHSVKSSLNDKTATVETLHATSEAELREIVKRKKDTWAHIASCYCAHNTVELQAATRRRLEGGKIPASDFRRLYDSFTSKENARVAAITTGRMLLVEKIVTEKWNAEQE